MTQRAKQEITDNRETQLLAGNGYKQSPIANVRARRPGTGLVLYLCKIASFAVTANQKAARSRRTGLYTLIAVNECPARPQHQSPPRFFTLITAIVASSKCPLTPWMVAPASSAGRIPGRA